MPIILCSSSSTSNFFWSLSSAGILLKFALKSHHSFHCSITRPSGSRGCERAPINVRRRFWRKASLSNCSSRNFPMRHLSSFSSYSVYWSCSSKSFSLSPSSSFIMGSSNSRSSS